MARYPAFSIFRNALSGQKHWQRAWRAAEPAYDAVIIDRDAIITTGKRALR